jgi:SagB-type dehydrogenase family enzyme
MLYFLHSYFHNQTNDRSEGGKVNIPKNREDWPNEWKEDIRKVHANYDAIVLKRPLGSSLLLNLLYKRDSSKVRYTMQDVTLEDLTYILFSSYGYFKDDQIRKRPVPSAGGMYSLHLYIIINEGHDLLPGIYHYAPHAHVLEPVVLMDVLKMKDFFASLSGYDFLWNKSVAIVITSKFDRPVSKYGSRAYRYLLLESGHVGQNIALSAAERGKSVLPVGSFNEVIFEKELGIQDGGERVLYSLFL